MPLSQTKKEELFKKWTEFRAKKGIATHPADIYDYWLTIIDSLLDEKVERVEKLFKEAEKREDRVEITDVIKILKE